MIKSGKHLSGSLRVILIATAVLLLQLNIPVFTAFQSSWSADICLNKVQQPTNTWENFQTLVKSASENVNRLVTGLNTDKLVAMAKSHSSAKSFKIVKVESKRTTANHLNWPVIGRISSGYGMRRHPVTYRRSFHNGIDIKAKRGTSITAPADGVVVSAGRAGLLGRMVKIRTAKGLNLYFGHMYRIKCKKGQKIKCGQLIGTVGSSGRATGPHLHFSVKSGRNYINPTTYLPSK